MTHSGQGKPKPADKPQPHRYLRWKSSRAEEAVANRLRKQGYQILARNWRHSLGELDIVARTGATLVFVEVKARHSPEEGMGLEAIDRRKQRRLRLLAQAFANACPEHAEEMRFDVAEVQLDAAGNPREVRYVEQAF